MGNVHCHVTKVTVEFLISPTAMYKYSMDSTVIQKPDMSCKIETVYLVQSRGAP